MDCVSQEKNLMHILSDWYVAEVHKFQEKFIVYSDLRKW